MRIDQRRQNVSGGQQNFVEGNQYNARGDMHVGGEQKAEDIAKLLEALKRQLVQARQQGTLDADVSIEAEETVNKALLQTQQPQPDKKKLLMYLNAAKGYLESVASAGSVVASLVNIAEMVRRLF